MARSRTSQVQRLDTAEILSFRLKVPLRELEEMLRGPTGQELGLELSDDGNERVLQPADGSSFLRFRVIGADAILTEVSVTMDVAGAFFERVLGILMVRHLGDLHARLVWNVAERNVEGGLEVRIQRGVTDYPPLVRNVAVGPPSLPGGAGEAGPGQRPPPLPATRRAAKALAEAAALPPSPEEQEIVELLGKARSHWEEYQRLKAARGRGNKPE